MPEEKKYNDITTPIGRVAFPCIKERNSIDPKNPKFTITLIFDEGTDLSAMKKEAGAVARKRWPNKLPKNLANPFHDSGEKDNLDGYEEGKTHINVSSNYRPQVVNAKRELLEIEDMDIQLYGGCYARVIVNFYAYEYMGKKGVGIGLQAVQVAKDGEPFGGGGVNAQDAFESLDEEEELDFGDGANNDIPF